MPFPPNSTERFQKREAERNAELNRFRDRMADISRRRREDHERIFPPKTDGASGPAGEFTTDRMISLMVGRSLNQFYPMRLGRASSQPALEARSDLPPRLR